jgi:hypothetical protein
MVDFLAQALLDQGMSGQDVESPSQETSGSVTTCDDEVESHIAKEGKILGLSVRVAFFVLKNGCSVTQSMNE